MVYDPAKERAKLTKTGIIDSRTRAMETGNPRINEIFL